PLPPGDVARRGLRRDREGQRAAVRPDLRGGLPGAARADRAADALPGGDDAPAADGGRMILAACGFAAGRQAASGVGHFPFMLSMRMRAVSGRITRGSGSSPLRSWSRTTRPLICTWW